MKLMKRSNVYPRDVIVSIKRKTRAFDYDEIT